MNTVPLKISPNNESGNINQQLAGKIGGTKLPSIKTKDCANQEMPGQLE